MSLKMLKKIAKERNEDHHVNFIRRMVYYESEDLGFIDKTSKDERTTTWHIGRLMKGQCTAKKKMFVHDHQVSGLGLLTVDGMIAIAIIKGSSMTLKYKTFLE
ncbi:hypothetical protein EDD22DRAFT_844906 [Suillus occidentalis]|nr:hypothetical protein EDD22DRAFT_844906 [Suillus occidentalis]